MQGVVEKWEEIVWKGLLASSAESESESEPESTSPKSGLLPLDLLLCLVDTFSIIVAPLLNRGDFGGIIAVGGEFVDERG